jgi:hypothetical protein
LVATLHESITVSLSMAIHNASSANLSKYRHL